jgi:thiol-disulfide isomerase/thioredoxin
MHRLSPMATDLDLPPLKPTITSKAQFDQMMADAKGPVVVDFLMNGCEPCAEAGPELEKLGKDCSGNAVTIGSVDIDAPWATELADKLKVDGTPTALFAESAEKFLAGETEEVEVSSKAIRSKLKCAVVRK